jgi:kinesin family member 2/24
MASSTSWTSSENLPQFLSLVSEWRAGQSLVQDFAGVGDDAEFEQKDVFVAFRTRPPLPNEEKTAFSVSSDVSVPEPAGSQSEFCPGISVASAFPGEFYAHVPSLKVCFATCYIVNDGLIFIVERIDFDS